jgi:hypothetical protein
MLLMQVSQAETSVPGFERHTLKCSACPQIARRLVSSHPKLPVANLPAVVTHPEPPASKLRTERATTPSAWPKVAEKLRSRHAPPKHGWEAARTSTWAEAVEKLRRRQAALKEEALIASRSEPAEPVQAPAATSGPSASSPAPKKPAASQNAWERAVAKVRARQNGGSQKP